MMNGNAYVNDFKEIRDLNFFRQKGNTRYINKSKFKYIMPLWAYNGRNKIQKLLRQKG